jgi:hypothetical protein
MSGDARWRSRKSKSPVSISSNSIAAERGGRSLYGKSPAQSEQFVLLDWLPPDHLGGKSRQFLPRKHPAEILALGPSCASHRCSSNANSLMRPEFGWITGICATFQRDILRRHF